MSDSTPHSYGGGYGQVAPYSSANSADTSWQHSSAPGPYSGSQAPSASPGWTPAPKPGLIPLRPLTFGELFSATFRLLRTNSGTTIGTALIVMGLMTVFLLVGPGIVMVTQVGRVQNANPDFVEEIGAGALTALIVSLVLASLVSFVGSALMQGVLALSVVRGALGEKAPFRETWKLAFKRVWPLVLLSLLIGVVASIVILLTVGIVAAPSLLSNGESAGVAITTILAIIAYIAFFVVMIWLSVKLALAPSAIVLEGKGPIAGIRRSFQLTKNNFWRTLGVQFLVQLVAQFALNAVVLVVQFIVMIGFSLLFPLGVNSDQSGFATAMGILMIILISIVTTLASAILLVLTAGAASLIYLDLRMRKEGLGVRLTKEVEDRAAGKPRTPDAELFRDSISDAERQAAQAANVNQYAAVPSASVGAYGAPGTPAPAAHWQGAQPGGMPQGQYGGTNAGWGVPPREQ